MQCSAGGGSVRQRSAGRLLQAVCEARRQERSKKKEEWSGAVRAGLACEKRL